MLFRPRLLKAAIWVVTVVIAGCATIRVTDPGQTADELYLMNVASKLAVDQISATVLKDRLVYLDSQYLTAQTQPSDQQQYLIGELRDKLLRNGVRLTQDRYHAEVIMEIRSQGISNNRIEFLLGLPASTVGGFFSGGIASATPEIAIVKRTQQFGFSSVAFIAYWRDTGEVVAASGPFVGRTRREDYWFFGYGPRTVGNIPPAEPVPVENSSGPGDEGKKPQGSTAAQENQKPKNQNPSKTQ